MSKKETNEKPAPKAQAPQVGGPAQPIFCGVQACKEKPHRFGFCRSHHEQYEFGLIKGDGKPAADFEKKVVHFEDYLEKKKKLKVSKAA